MNPEQSAADDTAGKPEAAVTDAPKKHKAKKRARAGTAARKRERERELAVQLAMELTTLRSTLAEIIERFHVRVGGQYAELIGQLGTGETDAKAPPADLSQAMIDRIRKTALKPRKARAKDLGKLEELAEALEEMLPSSSTDP